MAALKSMPMGFAHNVEMVTTKLITFATSVMPAAQYVLILPIASTALQGTTGKSTISVCVLHVLMAVLRVKSLEFVNPA